MKKTDTEIAILVDNIWTQQRNYDRVLREILGRDMCFIIDPIYI